MPQMKRKHQLIAFFLFALFIASQSYCSPVIMVHAADSGKATIFDFRVRNTQQKTNSFTRHMLAYRKSAGAQVKEIIQKVPSGPNPIGNRHPPSIHV
ncbi:hypothetical protein MANES_07G114000v8 [Manihot esculenta]|uniref:Uncharacterized protein n=1 Tax=Manihot esculenta TaxID=3983 RepID=A0A2C9VMY2_MANES|nr:hypothetical protein MANES_07G114000v8 [Manihot esculenta]